MQKLQGMAKHGDHTVLVADSVGNKVWEYDWRSKSKEVVWAPSLQVELNTPMDVAVMPNGDVVVADANNDCVRRWDGVTWHSCVGECVDYRQRRGEPHFNYPSGLAVIDEEQVYVADDHRVRELNVYTGAMTDVCRTKHGPEHRPKAVVAFEGSPVFVEDHCVRQGTRVIAGNGHAGNVGGPALSARFTMPTGVAVVGGAFWIADGDAVRQLKDGQVTTIRPLDDARRLLQVNDNLVLVSCSSGIKHVNVQEVALGSKPAPASPVRRLRAQVHVPAT